MLEIIKFSVYIITSWDPCPLLKIKKYKCLLTILKNNKNLNLNYQQIVTKIH